MRIIENQVLLERLPSSFSEQSLGLWSRLWLQKSAQDVGVGRVERNGSSSPSQERMRERRQSPKLWVGDGEQDPNLPAGTGLMEPTHRKERGVEADRGRCPKLATPFSHMSFLTKQIGLSF